MKYKRNECVIWRLEEWMDEKLKNQIIDQVADWAAGMDTIIYDYEIYDDKISIEFININDFYLGSSTYEKIKRNYISYIEEIISNKETTMTKEQEIIDKLKQREVFTHKGELEDNDVIIYKNNSYVMKNRKLIKLIDEKKLAEEIKNYVKEGE